MPQRRSEPEPEEPNPEEVYESTGDEPEYYIDSMQFNTALYTSVLYLGQLRPGKKPLLKLKIKVSPPMLKAMALLLSKQMRFYEERVGPINLPKIVLHEWGLEEEI